MQYLTLQLIAFRNSVNYGKHRKTTSWLDKEQIREKDRRRNNDVDAHRTGFCILSGFLGISPSDSAHFRRLSPFFTSWDPIFPNLRRARFEGFENRLTELQVGTSFLCPHRNWTQLECCLWVTRWRHDGVTMVTPPRGTAFTAFTAFRWARSDTRRQWRTWILRWPAWSRYERLQLGFPNMSGDSSSA